MNRRISCARVSEQLLADIDQIVLLEDERPPANASLRRVYTENSDQCKKTILWGALRA
jgi:hypothetical protein